MVRFSPGEKVHSKLLNVTGIVKGYSNGCYAIEDSEGYVWHLDDKAELVKVK